MNARYVEWRASADLAAAVACTWSAEFAADGTPHVDRVIPDGCIDLLWNGVSLLIAGPDTESMLVTPRRGVRIAGLRFRPGAAALGVPASALLDQRVLASDVLGHRVGPLVDGLAECSSLRSAAALLEAHTRDFLHAPDPLVAGAIARLRVPHPTVRQLAADLGTSERQLRRRFVAAVGYGPKMLERVLRLKRFVALAGRAPLASIAGAAGYADQAHLTRECRELTGCTPRELAGYPVTAA